MLILCRVTVQIFLGPATSEKATLRHEILELGSYNNFAKLFIFQNHSTLLYALE